jgi:hypothetical protein
VEGLCVCDWRLVSWVEIEVKYFVGILWINRRMREREMSVMYEKFVHCVNIIVERIFSPRTRGRVM